MVCRMGTVAQFSEGEPALRRTHEVALAPICQGEDTAGNVIRPEKVHPTSTAGR